MSNSTLSSDSDQEKIVNQSSRNGATSAVEGRQENDVDDAEKGLESTIDNGPEVQDKSNVLQRTVTAQDCKTLFGVFLPV